MTTKDEALKLAIEKFKALPRFNFLLKHGGVTRWENKSGDWVERYEVIKIFDELDEACKETLENETSSSDTAEVQEPILFAVKDYVECTKHFGGQTLCAIKKSDLHTVPLYLHPAKNEASSLRGPLKRLSKDEVKIMDEFAIAIKDAMEGKNK